MAITLIVNTNTWITLTEANNYIEAIPLNSIWSALSDNEKKQYIVTAYRKIKYSNIFDLSSITQIIKDAQAELTYWLSKYMKGWEKRQALYSSGVRSFNLPDWSETLEKVTIPDNIIDMLEDYIKKGAYFTKAERKLD